MVDRSNNCARTFGAEAPRLPFDGGAHDGGAGVFVGRCTLVQCADALARPGVGQERPVADVGVLAVGAFGVAAAGGPGKAAHVGAGAFFGPVSIVGWWGGGVGVDAREKVTS